MIFRVYFFCKSGAFAAHEHGIVERLSGKHGLPGRQLTVTPVTRGVDEPLLRCSIDALIVCFMRVGLELKREVVEGQLSRLDQVAMPNRG